jgi:predicted naringenin-chalcone synthase
MTFLNRKPYEMEKKKRMKETSCRDKKYTVYIGDIIPVLPPVYPNEEIIDIIYSKKTSPDIVIRFAKRFTANVGIKSRPISIDLNKYPRKKLISQDHTPQSWGERIIDEMSLSVNKSQIGFLSVCYDTSSHQNKIPNLACQIAMENRLNLEQMPVEYAYYGCGSGILGMQSAVDFCSKSGKAGVVLVFNQSSWLCNPIYDRSHRHFKDSLRGNILFGDAGVGILLIPENLVNGKINKLFKIVDIDTKFLLGDLIKMTHNGDFLVNDSIKDVIPQFVSKKVILPMLRNHNLSSRKIHNWSIHQGGLTILNKFKDTDTIGLDESQISRSKSYFESYGNLSTASSFLILNSFFSGKDNGREGIITTFGAGYYCGAMLYESVPN